MELRLDRVATNATYTIGHLYVDGVYFCDTLEDADRGLRQDMELSELRRRKVSGITAIPTGRYGVRLDVVSPKYAQREEYAPIGGRLPRLVDVPGYSGVLIHIGNYPEDTEGCILVGRNKQKGAVLESRQTFFALYERLKEAEEEIFISVGV